MSPTALEAQVPRATAALLAALALVATAGAWGPLEVVGRTQGELRDHLWVAWLVRDRLAAGALPIWFPQAGFPDGISLFPLDPLPQLVLAALTPLLGPLRAVTALATAGLALVGIGVGALAQARGASPVGVFVAGALGMVGPPLLAPFADTQTEWMGAGLAFLLLGELAGPARGLRAALLGVAVLASTLQLALLISPIAILLFLRRKIRWRWAAPPVTAAALLAWGLVSAEASGRLASRASPSEWPPRTVILAAAPAPPPPSMVTSTDWPAWPSTGPRRWAGVALPLLALASVGRSPARWLTASSAVYAALAVGSARQFDWTELGHSRLPLPFDLLYRYIPFGSYLWKPDPFAVPAWGLAAAAAGTLRPPWLGLAAIAEVLARGPVTLPLPTATLAPRAAWSRLEQPGGVLSFPCRSVLPPAGGAFAADELLAQTLHHHAIGETFDRAANPIHRTAIDSLAAAAGWPARAGGLAEALQGARDAGFAWLLVRADLLDAASLAALRGHLSPILGPPREEPDGDLTWRLAP
jgi:hypothetical protein